MIKFLGFKKIFVCSTLVFLLSNAYAKGMPKEYFKIQDINKSKKYFLNYIYTLVEKENSKILKERNFLKNILNSNLLSLNFDSSEFSKLIEIKKRYRVKKLYDLNSYLMKVDIMPPSMALAQAAVESAWGKSRFIKQANNIFGHWTYNPKIGMKPAKREIGATHFIRIFKSMQDSISAYILNLNRNRAYLSFQKKRFYLRSKNLNPDGLILSQTMINYSGIADEYLKILKQVIKKNKLKEYDNKFYQNIKTKPKDI